MDRGNRDIERPENNPVDCFQRDGAGRPTGNRNGGKVAEQSEVGRGRRLTSISSEGIMAGPSVPA